MTDVDITADLNAEEQTGYVWTFLDEARDPSIVVPGELVVAGDADAPAVAVVVDLAPHLNGTIVHLDVLSRSDRQPRGPRPSHRHGVS